MDRAKTVFNHLDNHKKPQKLQFVETSARSAESADDVVICSALRTPICKARRGGLKVRTWPGYEM